MTTATTYANPHVLSFYREMPFNLADSPAVMAAHIRERNAAEAYPPLKELAVPGRTLLDVGCGAGAIANSIAYHYRPETVGIDFNPVAVNIARAVAMELAVPATFLPADLFLFRPKRPFDVVTSIGVLHHTDNCHAALRHVFGALVKRGGHALIGLYHLYGRRPFLAHFEAMRAAGASEEKMLGEFRDFFGDQAIDATHVLSWFRDQVLHPHETQHTLAELLPLIAEAGMEIVSTSINDFRPISSIERVLEEEIAYEEIAQQKLRARSYFPGFFVFVVRRKP